MKCELERANNTWGKRTFCDIFQQMFFTGNYSMSAILPICLPWSEHDPARSVNDTSYAVVTGWGKTKKGRESSVVHSKTLLKVKVPIADAQCRKEGGTYDIDSCTTNFLNQTCQICAGGEIGKWLLVMKKPQKTENQASNLYFEF